MVKDDIWGSFFFFLVETITMTLWWLFLVAHTQQPVFEPISSEETKRNGRNYYQRQIRHSQFFDENTKQKTNRKNVQFWLLLFCLPLSFLFWSLHLRFALNSFCSMLTFIGFREGLTFFYVPSKICCARIKRKPKTFIANNGTISISSIGEHEKQFSILEKKGEQKRWQAKSSFDIRNVAIDATRNKFTVLF